MSYLKYKGCIRLVTLFGCDTSDSENVDNIEKSYNSAIDTIDICKSNTSHFTAHYKLAKTVSISKIKVCYRWATLPPAHTCTLSVSEGAGVWIDKYNFPTVNTDQTTIEIDINETSIIEIKIAGALLGVGRFEIYEIWHSEGQAISPIFYTGIASQWGYFYADMLEVPVNSEGERKGDTDGITMQIRGSSNKIAFTAWETITDGFDLSTIFNETTKYLQMKVDLVSYVDSGFICSAAVSMLKATYWRGGTLQDKPCSLIWDNNYLLFSEKTLCLNKNLVFLTHSLSAFSTQAIEAQNKWYPLITRHDNRGIWAFDTEPYGTDFGGGNIINGTIITRRFFAGDPALDKIMNKIRIGIIPTDGASVYGSIMIYYKRLIDTNWVFYDTISLDAFNEIERRLESLNTKMMQIKLVLIPAVYDATNKYIYPQIINWLELETRLRPIQP